MGEVTARTAQGRVAVSRLPDVRSWLLGGLGLLAAAAAALPAHAQDAPKIIKAHGISTFGDLKYPADFTHLEYVNPDAPKGGEISEWTFGGFDSMNPYSVKGRAAALSSIMYESILAGTADEIGAAYCLLCETLEYPEDRSWVIFNLRPEAKFSDGTPVTAEDVVFSYETFVAKGLTDFRTIFAQQVEGAEALDTHRVKFTFKKGIPTRDLPQDVGGLPVLSKAQYEREGLDLEEGSLKPFLGSGAYVLDESRMKVGQTVVYRRNPDYWGKDLPLMRGTGNFDAIRIEYYADYNAAFEGFKGGSYTFRNEASSILWATGYDFPAVQTGHVVKVELPSGAKATGQGWMLNLRREKFQDPKVREALNLMFNFEWSNQTLFYGLYTRVDSFWENSYLEAEGAPSEAEAALLKPLVDEGLLPASILTEPPVSPPVSGERQLDRRNLRAASKLLDEAGWTVGSDGMRRNAKGEVLRVEFLNDSQTFDRVISPFVENLRALGVDALMTRVDNAQMESRTRPPSYDFDITTGNARTNYISGAELKQYYGSETADISAFNIMGLKDKAVDRMIEVVLAAKTSEELEVATKALDRVLRLQRFWVPQWYKASNTVAYYDMFEHPETLPPYALGELDFWWFNPDKAQALRDAGALRQ
ncbi:ABC transporter substrate-binding protein [Rhodobacter sphaeroides]|jgi:microcin C transport system substrate-binding protein|uniref:ABC peptide transporter, substrate binding protein n=2 Tax=Cereibacter sphaeroides TaxID=1063 RepID=Q3J004_CERS4|nr:extracellular solute-binding protein [Cereibacter sphaeroides]ABA79880.1 ABC peptide transporter, substrate binding protein [Cereibacter sphaeroides 2.4.1]AXC62085.1 ABC transporter substrate-binding protein [Cereibacter sphaeroides 2.4.1]MVX46957.1 ABC transporter substrate-binding protein [Cereibacter sphaeroides]QJC82981.1 ABC transporter substrate-binding protein [Cereibacter sphaeroides]